MLLLCLPLAVSAQVYKWTDAHGTVHFSDTAPPHGVKYTRVKTATRRTTTPAAASAKDNTADANGSGHKAADTDEPARTADNPANRKKLCHNLDANIKLLQGDRPVITQDDDGKPQVMSPSSRSQELTREQQQYQQFCG
jgi:hypothetical protein